MPTDDEWVLLLFVAFLLLIVLLAWPFISVAGWAKRQSNDFLFWFWMGAAIVAELAWARLLISPLVGLPW